MFLYVVVGDSHIINNSPMHHQDNVSATLSTNKIILIIPVPVAVETLGPPADEAQLFLAEIGRRATLCTADPREATFLYQRISVAI